MQQTDGKQTTNRQQTDNKQAENRQQTIPIREFEIMTVQYSISGRLTEKRKKKSKYNIVFELLLKSNKTTQVACLVVRAFVLYQVG